MTRRVVLLAVTLAAFAAVGAGVGWWLTPPPVPRLDPEIFSHIDADMTAEGSRPYSEPPPGTTPAGRAFRPPAN